ncbi:MAG: hypothetical protein ABJA84_00230 [Polaromonas sp.]
MKTLAQTRCDAVKLPGSVKSAAEIGVSNQYCDNQSRSSLEECAAFQFLPPVLGGSIDGVSTPPVSPVLPARQVDRAATPIGVGRGGFQKCQLLETIVSTPSNGAATRQSLAIPASEHLTAKLEQFTRVPRMPAFKGKGFFVYALYLGDAVVYVGSTKTIGIRMMKHVESEKDFDSYAIFPVDTEEEMFELEFRGIVQFDPVYNKTATATSKSGFRSASKLRLAHKVEPSELAEVAEMFSVETLHFRGKPYYNAGEMSAAMGAMA